MQIGLLSINIFLKSKNLKKALFVAACRSIAKRFFSLRLPFKNRVVSITSFASKKIADISYLNIFNLVTVCFVSFAA
jgi:hypothetical protein